MLRIFGDELFDDDARLMQDDMAKTNALRERGAMEGPGPTKGDVGAGLNERLQFARGYHLGQQHGRGLQRLDLLLGIGAARFVLDVEDAKRIAAAENRDPEERGIDFPRRFLAGTRRPDGAARPRGREVRRFRQ